MKRLLFLLLCCLASTGTAAAPSTAPVEFKDGDLVLLVGGTFIEREGRHGYLERELTLATGSKEVKFRNLGWSGDSVFGNARSYFDAPAKGLDRLVAQIAEVKPTVLLLSYGALLAHDESEGAEVRFREAYATLLHRMTEAAPEARLVLLSPAPLENLGPPFPDQTKANQRLRRTSKAIAKLAAAEKAGFVDLFALVHDRPGKAEGPPLTDDGVSYSERGYRQIARLLAKGLGLEPTLIADDELRALIAQKNFHYFQSWRPSNETYIRGFRKHEQGRHAADLPNFLPIVEDHDQRIHQRKLALLGKN